MRRALRILARSLLALLALLVLVWIFRKPLLVPLLRPQVEAALADLLGAERVSIGTLDGNWFTHLNAQVLAVQGAAPPVRSMRGVHVDAHYSLLTLLRGDLAGLRNATVTATDVELDLRPTTAEPDAEPELTSAANSVAHQPWRHWLPQGASVQIDRLRVLASHGERQGQFAVTLQPGLGERELVVTCSGVRVGVRTGAPQSVPAAQFQVIVDAEDPGALLDLFGLGAGVRSGALHTELALGFAPFLLQGQLDLNGLTHGDENLAKSRAAFRLDHERLAIERASLDLPGIAIELRGMTLPSPLASEAITLRDLAGSFVVRIDDLTPHASLLPEPLPQLLPIQGRLAGSAKDGILRLDLTELHTQGADLVIESGSMPIVSDDWRAAEGSVQFALTFTEFAGALPWLGATTVSGGCAGNLTGSLTQPRLDLRLDLGEFRSDRGAFASAQGTVRADATAVAVAGLRVQELQVAALASQAPTDVVLDASCGLEEWRVDPDSLVAKLELRSLAVEALLAPLLAEQGLGPDSIGLSTVSLQARHDADGITIETLRIRSAPGSPVEVAVDGEGILPVHWPGNGAATTLTEGTFMLRASAQQRTAPTQAPTLSLAGTLRVDARSTELEQLDITIGPARLRGAIGLTLGVAALIEPVADLSSTALQIALELEELDLSTLPAAWLGATQIAGRANGRVHAAGKLSELAPELLLTVADGKLRGEGLPPVHNGQLRIEVSAGNAATKTLLLTTTASASLDPELGLQEEISLAATIRCDDSGTTLEPSVLRLGGGELALALKSNLRHGDLLSGALDASLVTLAGNAELREFALEKLPTHLLGLDPVRGIVSGEVAVDGTLGPSFGLGLLQTARLSLRDGELKLSDVPRLERLTAELHADRHQVTLSSLTGLLGAGRFSAQGSLQNPDALLVESLDDAALELQIDGEDVLLYRGDGAKVRATIRAKATGTLAAIALGGDVVVGRGTKYVRRISMLPSLGTRGGAAVNEGLQIAPLPPAIGDRIDLDIAVTTREPIEVRAHLVDGDIDVTAHLRGKGSAPRLEGTMSVRKGMLRFPGANLAVDSGLLTFTRSQPLFPELLVTATGKRMGVVVTMTISGRYDQPQVQLTSVPAMPAQDLIVLLTTGQLPSTLAEHGATGQATFVGGYLAKEVFEKYFGSESTERGDSLFDRLTIESGRDVSQNGTESILIEYELLPMFSVQVERDAYEDYNLGLVLRFRFK